VNEEMRECDNLRMIENTSMSARMHKL